MLSPLPQLGAATNSVGDADVRVKILNLLQTTEDLIYFKDTNSVFTLCSDSLTRRITGGLDESLIGKSDFDLFDHESADQFYQDEQEIIRTGKPVIGREEKGNDIWVLTSKYPLWDTDGKIIGTFGVSRNINEQKLTELKLKETNQKLIEASRRAGMAEVATNVIHNVGNVLTSVKVAVAQSGDINDNLQLNKLEKVAKLIEENQTDEHFFREGHRGSHIPQFLRELTNSFKSEQAKVRGELDDSRRHLEHISQIVAQQQQHATGSKIIERVNLSDLISDAIQMSSSSLRKHNIDVSCDFEDGLFVKTDQHQVLQIVVNLIRNAKHACLDSGTSPRRIKILAANIASDQFTISVIDNGIGIAEENFVKLFNHGFTTREQGKGFGLHGSANTARGLGGSLSVHSDGIGKGATFVLTLPGKLN